MATTQGPDDNVLSFEQFIQNKAARKEATAKSAGWHRGVLAGLSPEEREQRIDAARPESLIGSDGPEDDLGLQLLTRSTTLEQLNGFAIDHAPETSLAKTLAIYTKDRLLDLARAFGVTGTSRMNKEQLGQALAQSILDERLSELADILASLNASPLGVVLRACDEGPISFTTSQASLYADLSPFPPFTFLFKSGDTFTFLMPDEIRERFLTMDRDALLARQSETQRAYNFVSAAVVFYGVIEFGELYGMYCEATQEPVSLDSFQNLVVASSADDDMADFALDVIGDDYYLVDPTASSRYAAQCAAGDLSEDLTDEEFGALLDRVDALLDDPGTAPSDPALASISDEIAALDRYRMHLLEEQDRLGLRPLDAQLLDRDVLDYLFDLPQAAPVLAYFDAHVPNDESDLYYADRMIEQIVFPAAEGSSFENIIDDLEDEGAFADAASAPTIKALVRNLYDAMPSWELAGWSELELREKASGKVFYNEDGTVRQVGRNDACPCGSGKKYKKCCGRSASEHE